VPQQHWRCTAFGHHLHLTQFHTQPATCDIFVQIDVGGRCVRRLAVDDEHSAGGIPDGYIVNVVAIHITHSAVKAGRRRVETVHHNFSGDCKPHVAVGEILQIEICIRTNATKHNVHSATFAL
jgi:hypothetical protein